MPSLGYGNDFATKWAIFCRRSPKQLNKDGVVHHNVLCREWNGELVGSIWPLDAVHELAHGTILQASQILALFHLQNVFMTDGDSIVGGLLASVNRHIG